MSDENCYEAPIFSIEQLKVAAYWSRVFCKCRLEDTFNPIFVMENVLNQFDNSFDYEIVDKSEWKHKESCVAAYLPDYNKIIVRSDVYERALDGDKKCIITIGHEVAHCIQRIIKDVLEELDVFIATDKCKDGSEGMAHHEEQTDVFTRFLMCPKDLLEGLSDQQAVENYVLRPLMLLICNVVESFTHQKVEVKIDMQNDCA